MKLYATTTSERASKGQGGNDFLEIKVQDKNKHTFLEVTIIPVDDIIVMKGYWVDDENKRSERYFQYETKVKGERQREDDNCRVIQNFGEQHPLFHSKKMKEWRKGERQKGECDCNMNYGNKDLQGSHDIDCNSRK